MQKLVSSTLPRISCCNCLAQLNWPDLIKIVYNFGCISEMLLFAVFICFAFEKVHFINKSADEKKT